MNQSRKIYITPAGAKKLREEYQHLKFTERPEVTKTVAWAASNGDRSENGDYIYGKRRLRQIDSRIHFLSKLIDDFEVVDPTTIQSDQVRFGATITIRTEDDELKTYSIVGVEEADAKSGKISWRSPLATALMRARVDDIVTFKAPKGEQEVEVVNIEYCEIA